MHITLQTTILMLDIIVHCLNISFEN